MNVDLLLVPYDTGQRGWRMGGGPDHLLRAGLVEHLERQGHDVATDVITDARGAQPAEIRTAFELMRRVALRVRAARESGRFPLVLSGNCSTACGTLSGLDPARRPVFWFDAHGDLNTPDTTTTGFLDGMALAIAQGLCWQRLAASIPGFRPVVAEDVFLLGARDLDPPERALVERGAPVLLPPKDLLGRLPAVLEAGHLASAQAYIHCDMDALDPAVGQANPFPAPGGLSLADLTSAIRMIAARVPVGAAAVTAYAPDLDPSGAICRAVFAVVESLVSRPDGD